MTGHDGDDPRNPSAVQCLHLLAAGSLCCLGNVSLSLLLLDVVLSALPPVARPGWNHCCFANFILAKLWFVKCGRLMNEAVWVACPHGVCTLLVIPHWTLVPAYQTLVGPATFMWP